MIKISADLEKLLVADGLTINQIKNNPNIFLSCTGCGEEFRSKEPLLLTCKHVMCSQCYYSEDYHGLCLNCNKKSQIMIKNYVRIRQINGQTLVGPDYGIKDAKQKLDFLIRSHKGDRMLIKDQPIGVTVKRIFQQHNRLSQLKQQDGDLQFSIGGKSFLYRIVKDKAISQLANLYVGQSANTNTIFFYDRNRGGLRVITKYSSLLIDL